MSPQSRPAQVKRKYIDRPEISEVFADGVERLSFDGSTLRMEFVVIRQDEAGGDLWAYTSARLVFSVQGANDLMDKMAKLQTALKERQAQPPAGSIPN